VAGLFYSDIERDYGQDLPVVGFEALTGIATAQTLAPTDNLFYSRIPYDFTQLAFFGEVSYAMTDELSVIAGARYYDFEEKRVFNQDGIFSSNTIGVPGRTTSDGVNPRVMIRWDWDDDTQINGQVSKGFRLGGINDALNTGACTPADLATFSPFAAGFQDEEVTNYEVGFKKTLNGGAGIFNASAFYADIEGLQVTFDAGSCSSRVVYNVPDASASGIEFEYSANLTDNFSLSVAGSWVDTSIDFTLLGGDPIGVISGVRDGNRFPTTPELQLAVTGTYDFVWNSDWDGYFAFTAQHVGDRYTQLADQEAGAGLTDPSVINIGAPTPTSVFVNPNLDAYQIVNVRLGARRDTWEVAAYINNLLDEKALQSFDREVGGLARFGYRVNQPLTVGANISYFFE
jgi:iron complex outermembrane receptor protein